MGECGIRNGLAQETTELSPAFTIENVEDEQVLWSALEVFKHAMVVNIVNIS